MKKDIDFGVVASQVQTNVGFTSFMTGVVVFFTGLLLTNFRDFDESIKVPIAFLIISIFGFLFSTLIYTNTAEEVSQKREERVSRFMFLGDVLSEYLGVYLLVASIPLIVNVITHDIFLRAVAIGAAIIGLALYQFSQVSILERQFPKIHRAVSALLLALVVVMYSNQLFGQHFILSALLFLGLMFVVAAAAMLLQDRA